VTRYRWVLARKAEGFPITAACEVADVSRQAFYEWRAREKAGPTEAEIAEAELVALMREIADEFDDTYGSPRMTVELANRGQVVNHKRVERLMRLHGLVGVDKPTRVRTTIPAEDVPPLPDLVQRGFEPGAPDVTWVGDITYVPTNQCWLFLATVIDLGSRRLLGYPGSSGFRVGSCRGGTSWVCRRRAGSTPRSSAKRPQNP
jgi:hypothetical protein